MIYDQHRYSNTLTGRASLTKTGRVACEMLAPKDQPLIHWLQKGYLSMC